MNTSLVLRLPRKMHLCRSSSNAPRLPSFLGECYKTLTLCSLLTRSTIPCACHAKAHLNLQKWREHVVLCAFWLRNVLRATTACTFSTSQLPKVVRAWCVLYILTSECALRHNGVHFFDISASKSGPRMVCFVHFDFEMCFAPQRRAIFYLSSGQMAPHPPLLRAYLATNHWKKHSVSRLPTFSRICIFFLLTLSLLWSSLFCSSLLPDSSHLCFSSVHIVGSLTSKLPSIIAFTVLHSYQ